MDITQVGALLGNPSTVSKPSLYDLVSGSKQSTQSSLLSSLALQKTSSLSSTQSGALLTLQNYVKANVTGPEAEQLYASIAALESLMEFGSKNSGNLDPVFSLLASNPGIIGQPPAGSLVNQLL